MSNVKEIIMQNTTYTIALQTPIGIRNGSMDIRINGNIASGMMHILNHSEPFHGEINDNGKCNFTGQLVTRMRTIPYQAVGLINQDHIDLTLVGGKETFHLTGEVCE